MQQLASHGTTLRDDMINHMLGHKIAVDNMFLLNRWHMYPIDYNFEVVLTPVANSQKSNHRRPMAESHTKGMCNLYGARSMGCSATLAEDCDTQALLLGSKLSLPGRADCKGLGLKPQGKSLARPPSVYLPWGAVACITPATKIIVSTRKHSLRQLHVTMNAWLE